MLNKTRYILEYCIFIVFYHCFAFLPFKVASKMGALIGIYLGLFLSADKVAKKNLKMVFPEKEEKELEKISKGVWKNMGRYIAEFPHIVRMDNDELSDVLEVRGKENLQAAIKSKKGFVLFSAHFSNFELIAKYVNSQKIKTNMIYRSTNNPYINKKILSARNYDYFFHHHKGMKAMPNIVKSLLRGEVIASFIDQKLNEGEKIKFMGNDAMTGTLPANMALKYKSLLLPVHVLRDKGKYILIFDPAINPKNVKLDTPKQIMSHLNKIIAKWIRKDPEQWFWVHNRWVK